MLIVSPCMGMASLLKGKLQRLGWNYLHQDVNLTWDMPVHLISGSHLCVEGFQSKTFPPALFFYQINEEL